jgi:hypothetical protein
VSVNGATICSGAEATDEISGNEQALKKRLHEKAQSLPILKNLSLLTNARDWGETAQRIELFRVLG